MHDLYLLCLQFFSPACYVGKEEGKEGSELCMIWSISVVRLMVLWNTIPKPQQSLKIVNRQT